MLLPREVIIGNETSESISDLCKRLGFYESAIVVTDPHMHYIAGRGVPFISVPTTTSCDGIASLVCSLKGLNKR